jgi:hypothetical protein
MWEVGGWKGELMGVAWLGTLVGHCVGVGLSTVFAVFCREEGRVGRAGTLRFF